MAKARDMRNLASCHATALRKASRRLTQLYDDALAPAGLRSTQFAILATLATWNGAAPTLAELAQDLVTDRSSLGHNLRPLERDGYITLEEGEEDRRRRHIVITPTGLAKFQEARRLWQKAQNRLDTIFGQSEAARLRATLLALAHDERLGTLKD
jgi:DNA-binding MarR family transcriptional regulator